MEDQMRKHLTSCIGIYCKTSSCKHYFEDSCMFALQGQRICINENHECNNFEYGVFDVYEAER